MMPASFSRYLIEIERHLEVSNRPSAMAMMLLRTVGPSANDIGTASMHVLAGEAAAFQLGGGFRAPWHDEAFVLVQVIHHRMIQGCQCRTLSY